MKARLAIRQRAWQCQSCRSQLQPSIQLISRGFSTTIPHRQEEDSFQAAPPIDLDKPADNGKQYARIVPESPSYFTASPRFNDTFLQLQDLLRKYQTLPSLTPAAAPPTAWQKLADYRTSILETVKASKYNRVIEILKRLNRIHPDLMPAEVSKILAQHRRSFESGLETKTTAIIDEDGRAMGVGRRKESSARVFLVEGNGEILVNGQGINNVFSRIHDRESAMWALKATGRLDKYNVWALVSGGGTTGQAEAVTLAVANALLVHEPALKPALRRAGVVSRDRRRVERKKPGHRKARKKPAWVKR